MTRASVVLAVGVSAAAVGAFLVLCADALATHWQPTESGDGWGGTTDPNLRRTYGVLGLASLCFGLVLLAMTAWHYLRVGRDGAPLTPDGSSL